MEMAPSSAMSANHTTITGPNSRPMTAVPLRWTANSASRITSASGST